MFSSFFFYYSEREERIRRCHAHEDTYFDKNKKSVGGEKR